MLKLNKLSYSLIFLSAFSSVGCFNLGYSAFKNRIDLESVYQTALDNAPQLKSYQYQNLSAQEGREIAFGPLLPQINLSGQVSDNQISGEPGYKSSSYTLSASQTLFNLPQTFNYLSASDTASAAQHKFEYHKDQFIINLVSAYLTVTNAQENLKFSLAQKHFLKQMLKQINAKFSVGLVKYTDKLQAQANYDQSKAEVIQAQSALIDAKEQLWIYTHKHYKNLLPIQINAQFSNPNPNKLSIWLARARVNNPLLKSSIDLKNASLEGMRAGYSNNLPSISIQASVNKFNNNSTGSALASIGYQHQKNITVGLNFTWTPFSGGAQWAQARQLADQYAASSANQLGALRSSQTQAKKAFLAVQSDVLNIQSYRQSVRASKASLAQLKAQYKVGAVSLVEVLNGVSALYQSQVNYAAARKQYILNWLALYQSAGLLSDQTVFKINQLISN